MTIIDRTAHSPASYRVRQREPGEVDLAVLHQTAMAVLPHSVLAGGANSCVITFAATGGTPDLAEVSAGAGTLYISYEAVA